MEKADIPLLVEALRVPPIFKSYNGLICDGTEALCIVLKRFARISVPLLVHDFDVGRSVAELCMINNKVVVWIYNVYGQRVSRWNHAIMDPASLSTYADAIHNRGAAIEDCFGFIDGTVRPISRPIVNKRNVYNGNKRVHALKFQSVTLPNGLIGQLYGPVGENLRVLIIP